MLERSGEDRPGKPQDAAPNSSAKTSAAPGTGDAEAMRELRRLLLGDEQRRLAELENRVGDAGRRAQDVGNVIAEAVLIRNHHDGKFTQALTPTIEKAITESVRRDPQSISDAIFPIMGPAIRKAIGETLSRMLESLNQSLAHSLSPRALKWRLEAWRTGKSFTEVVFLHTLVYRVEQVLLIHRNTGLLLQHVVAHSVDARDGDMVSGMLTAIQDFVRDSFGAVEGESLDAMQVGGLTVWVERGPQAALAAVIRGTPAHELRETLQIAIETVHLEMAETWKEFSGDAAPFDRVQPVLEKCLAEAKQERTRKGPPILAMAVLLAIAALIGFWWYAANQAERRWQNYVDRLRAEPGIVVTEAHRSGGRYEVRGLRDPLAADPVKLIGDAEIAPEKLDANFAPFHAATPEFVLQRAKQALAPPTAVTVTFAEGTLKLAGTAPQQWIDDAGRIAPAVSGVTHVDTANLIAGDLDEQRLATLKRILAPPVTVKLALDHGTLTATGTATSRWIDDATVLSRTLPFVDRFDAKLLESSDRVEQILAIATQRLNPPQTITLHFDNGSLTARGSATSAWIRDARLLARTVTGATTYDDKAVAASDVGLATLESAQTVLQPPATVKIAIDNGVLTLTGSSTQQWADDARLLARAVPGISRVDDRNLTITDRDQVVLDRARAILMPPPTVKLSLVDGALIASGSADHNWVTTARVLARAVQGIKSYREQNLIDTEASQLLLAEAIRVLRPPGGVTLKVEGDTLTATGSCDSLWLGEARRLSATIPGIKHFDDAALVAAAHEALNAAGQRLGARNIYFVKTTPTLNDDQSAAVAAAVEDMKKAFDAAAITGNEVSVEVIGQTDNNSPHDENVVLSLERSESILRMLTLAGVDPKRLKRMGNGELPLINEQRNEEQKALQRRVYFRLVVK